MCDILYTYRFMEGDVYIDEVKKKTKTMLAIEEKIDQDLISYMVENIPKLGLSQTAIEIGVTSSRLNEWVLRFGLHKPPVMLRQGDSVTINRREGSKEEYSYGF